MCTYRENGIQNPYVVDLPTLVRFLVFVFFLLLLLFILSWTIEVSLQRFTSTALIFQIECLDDLIFFGQYVMNVLFTFRPFPHRNAMCSVNADSYKKLAITAEVHRTHALGVESLYDR